MITSTATSVQEAEQRVIRAAMSCLDKNGWIFSIDGKVHNVDKARKLEDVLASLKLARKEARRGK